MRQIGGPITLFEHILDGFSTVTCHGSTRGSFIPGHSKFRQPKRVGNANNNAQFTDSALEHRLAARGSAAPVVSHLVDAGKLTLADVRDLEKRLAAMEAKK
jgi:hypothetical protein